MTWWLPKHTSTDQGLVISHNDCEWSRRQDNPLNLSFYLYRDPTRQCLLSTPLALSRAMPPPHVNPSHTLHEAPTTNPDPYLHDRGTTNTCFPIPVVRLPSRSRNTRQLSTNRIALPFALDQILILIKA